VSEAHDNTAPAKRGSYNVSKAGVVYYFPIEDAEFLKPSLALILVWKSDGEVGCSIDQTWMPLKGMDAE
jgi:hypothetical protein